MFRGNGFSPIVTVPWMSVFSDELSFGGWEVTQSMVLAHHSCCGVVLKKKKEDITCPWDVDLGLASVLLLQVTAL